MDKNTKKTFTAILMSFSEILIVIGSILAIGLIGYGLYALCLLGAWAVTGMTGHQITWTIIGLIVLVILIRRTIANYYKLKTESSGNLWERLF